MADEDRIERRQFVKLDPRITYANVISATVTVVGGVFVAGMLYSQQQDMSKALLEQRTSFKEAVELQRRVDEKQEEASKERYNALQSSIEKLSNRVDTVLNRR